MVYIDKFYGVIHMRKILSVISVALLCVAVLSGCGPKDKSKIDVGETNTKPEEEKKDEYVVKLDDSFDSGVDLSEKRETLSPEEADFRNLKWGMTKDEVTYAQGTGYREPDESTLYYTRLREEGYPADAEYTFEEGKLVMGVFYIVNNKEDSPVAIADYDDLCNTLAQRFGEPTLVSPYYADGVEETDDKEQQLQLIRESKLQLRTGWMLEGTELRVVMFLRNGEPCIGLQYKKA